MKKSKILAAIFSITVLLSGACLVGCSGTNGVFAPTYNDWQEGENKVGNATINLTDFSKVELNWDNMKYSDIEDIANSYNYDMDYVIDECLPSSFRADNSKLCSAFRDENKYESLQNNLSKLHQKPTEAQTKAVAQELIDNHVALYKRSSEDSSDSVKEVLLWQVRMTDELFKKILETGVISEVGTNVYEYKDDTCYVNRNAFYSIKNGDILTFVVASSNTTSRVANYSEILSY